MTLPGAEWAVVDVEKLRGYCLNPMHARGRHKARVFSSVLALHQSDAHWLRRKLLEAALVSDAIVEGADDYGVRYSLDFECVNHNLIAAIRSSWIVRTNEAFPRLITCYVLCTEVW